MPVIPLFPNWMSRFCLVAAAFLSIDVTRDARAVASPPDQPQGTRRPNKYDEFFRYMAQQLAEPSLCEKIPWTVIIDGGWGYGPSYERSGCYDTIAGNTKNPLICSRVRQLGPVNPNIEQTSTETCLKHAKEGFQSGMGISQGDLVEFFNQMGYDPDTIQLEGITPAIVQVKDIYSRLTDRLGIAIRTQAAGGPHEVLEPGTVNQAELVKRIENAIGDPGETANAKVTDIVDAAYLADMAAMVSKDSRWCFRIQPNLPLATERGGFRSWCLFTLAKETKDDVLCERIPIPADGTDPRMSLHAECHRLITSTIPTSAHYGPEAPVDDERIRELLGLLKVDIPRARDLPPDRIYAAYGRFLEELSHGKDARHLAARQRFIDRVERLQDSN
jgi:hypothetical protein